ncbi:MAG TPA: hypothetical protein VFU86_06580 [Terriglobales bacterium]|nr:hypothetical protein [Terriglobales bacterium]
MNFVEALWTKVEAAFAKDQREQTHERLKAIAEEQNRRRYYSR